MNDGGGIFALILIAFVIVEITKANLWEEILFVIVLIVSASIWWANSQEKRRKREAYDNKQREIRTKTKELVVNSQKIVEVLPNRIDIAKAALNEAEQEFEEGAFAPFWDAVEKAVTNLGYFDQEVKHVVANSSQHKELIKRLDNNRPNFSILLRGLPDPRATSARLRSIVRRAQKDLGASILKRRTK